MLCICNQYRFGPTLNQYCYQTFKLNGISIPHPLPSWILIKLKSELSLDNGSSAFNLLVAWWCGSGLAGAVGAAVLPLTAPVIQFWRSWELLGWDPAKFTKWWFHDLSSRWIGEHHSPAKWQMGVGAVLFCCVWQLFCWGSYNFL